MKDNKLYCELCGQEVSSADDFCYNCGSVFHDGMKCVNHAGIEAEGVCIICMKPFCSYCGDMIDEMFLCSDHERYEIIQNHARIKGGSFETELQFYKECLEQEGLHPVIFNRKMSPRHLGGTDYTLFRASGEYNGHLINEIKLMVPCSEVLAAEAILSEMEMNDTDAEVEAEE